MTDLVVPVPLPPQLARLRNYAGPPAPAGTAARSWFEFRNATGTADGAQGDTAELLIYDDIGDGGWYGGGVSASSFADALRQVTAPNLTVRLNSPGGDVFDGITVANQLRACPSNVTVVVDGLAASIASVIAMAGDRVVMAPQSQMMIHDASGLDWGNAADHRATADLLDRQSDNIAAAYRAKAGGMAKSWRTRMQAETWYSADEAVAAGLADAVATVPTTSGPSPSTANPSTGYDDWWDRTTKTFDLAARFRYSGRAAAPSPDGLTTRHQQFDVVGERGPESVTLASRLAADVRAFRGDQEAQTAAVALSLVRAGIDPDIAAEAVGDPSTPGDDAPVVDDQAPAEQPPDVPADGEESPVDGEETPADLQDPAEDVQEPAPEPIPVDEWASAVAHLTLDTPAAEWAAATRHLTGA